MCIINVNTTEKIILHITNNINLDTIFIKSIVNIVNLFKVFLIIRLSKNAQFLLFWPILNVCQK